jgi:hypothetical protein
MARWSSVPARAATWRCSTTRSIPERDESAEGSAVLRRLQVARRTTASHRAREASPRAGQPTLRAGSRALARWKQIALLLRENSRTLNSFVILSSDEARPGRAARASRRADGRPARGAVRARRAAFITFRRRTSPTKGDWVGWLGTWDDIVQGREDNARALREEPRGGDARTRAGCYRTGRSSRRPTATGGKAPPYIVGVRFTLPDLPKSGSGSISKIGA